MELSVLWVKDRKYRSATVTRKGIWVLSQGRGARKGKGCRAIPPHPQWGRADRGTRTGPSEVEGDHWGT